MFLKSGLIDVEEIIARAVFLGGGGVGAPLAQAGHFLREVEFLAAFGFDDPDGAVRIAGDKVRDVVREVAIGLHVVELEANREVVLGEGLHV